MTFRAKRSLGQNFLHDENVIARIVDALNLTSADTVVEIGPGTGTLTRHLADKAGRVVAIEFDRDLIPPLMRMFSERPNVRVVNADALDINLATLDLNLDAKLAANLPYNISTAILQRLVEHRHLFERLVLMFQREVVDRITAPPGKRDRGYLSVLVEDTFRSERLFDVPPGAFRPVPKVWSSVVRLFPTKGEIAANDIRLKAVSDGFVQKRKTILNNLKGGYPDIEALLKGCDIDPKRRAETLTLDEWRRLTASIENKNAAGRV
jgi:16S rRNA (adenine1518-N6/adenine1519-N6)-dimethyltransferase